MLQRLIADLKESAGTAARMTLLAVAAAVGLFITICFLCAAAFVFVLERDGLVAACFTGAAIFFVVTLIAAISYMVRKRKAKAAAGAHSAVHPALADPMLMAAGLQLVRAIGVKRLLPILAVAGIALGFLASRQSAGDQAPAE